MRIVVSARKCNKVDCWFCKKLFIIFKLYKIFVPSYLQKIRHAFENNSFDQNLSRISLPIHQIILKLVSQSFNETNWSIMIQRILLQVTINLFYSRNKLQLDIRAKSTYHIVVHDSEILARVSSEEFLIVVC